MRLKKSRNAAEEEIIACLNEGYALLRWLPADYRQKRTANSFNPADHKRYVDTVNQWGHRVILTLNAVFPTALESNQFRNPSTPFRALASEDMDDHRMGELQYRLEDLLNGLDTLRRNSLARYTDLPGQARLYVEDIDSFSKVRDVNPEVVKDLLGPNGYFDVAEEEVQLAIETILKEPFHKKDWGGEQNDLYTSNLIAYGARRATAFLLKGNGLRVQTMEIKHCGKNGDQLVRLVGSPAELFVVQFVGNVSESLVKDIEGKIELLRAQGKPAAYCAINGLDTARLFRAYRLA